MAWAVSGPAPPGPALLCSLLLWRPLAAQCPLVSRCPLRPRPSPADYGMVEEGMPPVDDVESEWLGWGQGRQHRLRRRGATLPGPRCPHASRSPLLAELFKDILDGKLANGRAPMQISTHYGW